MPTTTPTRSGRRPGATGRHHPLPLVLLATLPALALVLPVAGCGSRVEDGGSAGGSAGGPAARATTAAPGVAVRPTGPYLGQPLPGREPRLFAPGIVSTGLAERDLAVSPAGDEICWSVSIGNHAITTILRSRLVAGRWTAPAVAPFARDDRYDDLEPAFAPTGNRLWFASTRPRPDAVEPEPQEAADLWYVEPGPDGDWGEPVWVGPPVASDAPEFFPSLTRDGTLYFTRDDPRTGQSAIWRARPAGAGFAEPERLPDRVNSTPNCFNACVAPDESYLIVPTWGRGDALGGADYYVCFRGAEDSWTEPLHLGTISSEAREEWSPSVTADGRLIFFMTTRRAPDLRAGAAPLTLSRLLALRGRPGNGLSDVWWVDAGILADLRHR